MATSLEGVEGEHRTMGCDSAGICCWTGMQKFNQLFNQSHASANNPHLSAKCMRQKFLSIYELRPNRPVRSAIQDGPVFQKFLMEMRILVRHFS